MTPPETKFTLQNKCITPYWPMIKHVMHSSGKVSTHEMQLVTRFVHHYERLRDLLQHQFICTLEARLWTLNDTDMGGWTIWLKIREPKHQAHVFSAVIDLHRVSVIENQMLDSTDFARSLGMVETIRAFNQAGRMSGTGSRCHPLIHGPVNPLLQELMLRLSPTHVFGADKNEEGALTISMRDKNQMCSVFMTLRSMASTAVSDMLNNEVLRNAYQNNQDACVDYATGWVFH